MYLKERDKLVFKTLEKMRFLDALTITKLCGFTQYCKCVNRLSILCENGYIQYEQQTITSKRYYFLTGKGMNILFPPEKRVNKKGKVFNSYKKIPRFSLVKANHEITVANVLTYLLKCNPELTIDDFETDREMQKKTPEQKKLLRHCCDLLCKEYRVKVEVELTSKQKKLVANNISLNGDKYVQIWIAGSNQVYNLLLKLKKQYSYYFIVVIRLEELEQQPLIFSKLYDELLEFNPRIERKERQLSIDDV